MLIDELISELAPASGADIRQLIPRLKSAQKFVLGPEFAAVAEALGEDYSGLVKVFDRCRLPYAETWIEWLQADRPKFSAAGIQLPEVQKAPKRIGALLSATATDLSAWKAHLFWNFENQPGHCGAALFAMLMDTKTPIHHQTALPTEQELKSREFFAARNITAHPGWVTASEEVRLIMSNHTSLERPDFPLDFPDVPPHKLKELGQLIRDMARSDWAGEVSYILAVLGMLNARNAVETEAVDYTRLNKARIKSGKLPLFEHKILKIAQRQIRRVYPDGKKDSTHAPMRAHFCMGHWKIRRTGIFFWRPHLRGSKQRGEIEKDYVLK
jgi:hypothetical protein